jgi:hypothetical protein
MGTGMTLLNRSRQVGGSLGIAIMGTLVAPSICVGPATQGPEIGSTFPRDGAARWLPKQAGSSRPVFPDAVAALMLRDAARVTSPSRTRASQPR